MALDFTKLRDALSFTSKDQGAPNLTLDVLSRCAINKPELGGLSGK